MNALKLLVGRHINQSNLRMIYILLSLVALALAGGAPDDYGG